MNPSSKTPFSRFRNDTRGQSVLIGVIFLIGILVVALAIYQAQVVPQQNANTETESFGETMDSMVELQSNVIQSSTQSTARSVTVITGTRYQDGLFRVNPLPAEGSLTTETPDDGEIRINNANGSEEGQGTESYWDGSEKTFDTKEITFENGYNEITAENITYSSGGVFIGQNTQRSLSNSELVDGREINLVSVNGDLDEQGVQSNVPLRTQSKLEESVVVRGDDEPIEISLPSTKSASLWEENLPDEVTVTNESDERVLIALPENTRYELSLSSVRVGDDDGNGQQTPSYMYRVTGDGLTTQDEQSFRLQTQLRDQFNNPVSGEDITVEEINGDNVDIDETELMTNSRGVVTMRGEGNLAGNQNNEQTAEIRFTHDETGVETTHTVIIQPRQTGGPGNGGPGNGGGLSITINGVSTSNVAGEGREYTVNWGAEADDGIDEVIIEIDDNDNTQKVIDYDGETSASDESVLESPQNANNDVTATVVDVNGQTASTEEEID